MRIYVQNQQDKVPAQGLRHAVRPLLEEMGRRLSVDAGAEVSLTWVDDEAIASLNSSYRGMTGPTDVLSFALNETGTGEPTPPDPQPGMLGDVVISLQTAQRQADQYGHSLEREVCFLALHGFLHLLGYDHDTAAGEQRMEELSEAVLQSAGLARDGHGTLSN